MAVVIHLAGLVDEAAAMQAGTRSAVAALAAIVALMLSAESSAGAGELPRDAKLSEVQRLRRDADEEAYQKLLDPSRWQNLTLQGKAAAEEQQLQQLASSEESTRIEAINALAALGSKRAVSGLLKIATGREGKGNRDRWMAVRALGIIGDASAVPELVHLTYHYNLSTRLWAQISLVRLTGENFGRDLSAWKQWWTKQGGRPPIADQPVLWTTNVEGADAKKQDEEDRKFIETAKQRSPRRQSSKSQAPPSSDTAKTPGTSQETGSLNEQAIRGRPRTSE